MCSKQKRYKDSVTLFPPSVSVFFDIRGTVLHWWARSSPFWLPGEVGGVSSSGWWMIAWGRMVFGSMWIRVVSSVWIVFFVIALFTVRVTMFFTSYFVPMFITFRSALICRRLRHSRGTKSVQQKALVSASQRTFHPRKQRFNQLLDARYIREFRKYSFIRYKAF